MFSVEFCMGKNTYTLHVHIAVVDTWLFGMCLIPVYTYLSVRVMPLTCRLTSSSTELTCGL